MPMRLPVRIFYLKGIVLDEIEKTLMIDSLTFEALLDRCVDVLSRTDNDYF
jgi:hypothetical protein